MKHTAIDPRAPASEPTDLPTLPAECEPEHEEASPATPEAGPSGGTFTELLRSWIGRDVTMVDPESFEEAPLGFRIRPAFHAMRITEMSTDYVVLEGEFVHHRPGAPSDGKKGLVRHHVPISKIKRVSVLDGELLIHV